MVGTNARDKSDVARILAAAHRREEPGISRVLRIISDREENEDEPVKLLEVNRDASPDGILPITFNAKPPAIPFPSVVIEVTDGEFEQIRAGRLLLPAGWRLGEPL